MAATLGRRAAAAKTLKAEREAGAGVIRLTPSSKGAAGMDAIDRYDISKDVLFAPQQKIDVTAVARGRKPRGGTAP